jgi:hypothetical protein
MMIKKDRKKRSDGLGVFTSIIIGEVWWTLHPPHQKAVHEAVAFNSSI